MTNSLSIIVFFHFHSFASFQLVLSSSSSSNPTQELHNFDTKTLSFPPSAPRSLRFFLLVIFFGFTIFQCYAARSNSRFDFSLSTSSPPIGLFEKRKKFKTFFTHFFLLLLFKKIGKIPWIFVFHQTLDTARLCILISKRCKKKLISVLCNNWLHLTVTHGSLL